LEAHARLCEKLKLELPVIKVFEFRTAGALAKHLQETNQEHLMPSSPAARAKRQKRSFHLI
jgi:hypothetical protein